MRIAYLTSDFGVPVMGTKGASVHVRRMVSALAERGHELMVLTPSTGEGGAEPLPGVLVELGLSGSAAELHGELREEDVCIGNRLSKDLRNLFYSLQLESLAYPIFGDFSPDVLYERYTLFNTSGVELARRLDVPLILEVNAPLVEEQREQRGLSLPRVAAAAQRLAFGAADEVIVVSRWLEDYVYRNGARSGRVTVLSNAADAALFRPRSGLSALRARLGWQDRIVLVFVGAMKPWHGVQTLVEALASLGGAESPFRLLLVGEGPEHAATRERVRTEGLERAVHFTGAIPHGEIPEWLAAADIALAPYGPSAPTYFSPVKLFEYMSMGLPVVAPRVGQIPEIVEHGRTGWLYDSRAADEPAATLRGLVGRQDECRAVGRAARERVLARHTWAHNAERVEQLAARALARRGRQAGDPRVLVPPGSDSRARVGPRAARPVPTKAGGPAGPGPRTCRPFGEGTQEPDGQGKPAP